MPDTSKRGSGAEGDAVERVGRLRRATRAGAEGFRDPYHAASALQGDERRLLVAPVIGSSAFLMATDRRLVLGKKETPRAVVTRTIDYPQITKVTAHGVEVWFSLVRFLYALLHSAIGAEGGGPARPVPRIAVSCDKDEPIEVTLAAHHARRLLVILKQMTDVPTPSRYLGRTS